MRHKHYDCIVAGAEGKQIQYKAIRRVEDWQDISFTLIDWGDSSLEYRIKPMPKPDMYKYVDVRAVRDGICQWTTCLPEEANLRLIFDGETKQLKSAEVVG